MSFAAHVLQRSPALAERLGRADVERWLAGEESVEVDGERLWIRDGDRLADGAEMRLEWARAHGLVTGAELAALRVEWLGGGDGDAAAVDLG